MRLRTILVYLAVAALLTGCGVRGQLEPPSAANAPEGAEADERAPAQVEDRPFILDGLLL